MAALTWKNVGINNLNAGSDSVGQASTAFARSIEAFQNVNELLTKRKQVKTNKNTTDFIYGLNNRATTLEDADNLKTQYSTRAAEIGLSDADIDVTKVRSALDTLTSDVQARQELVTSRAIDQFDPGIALDNISVASADADSAKLQEVTDKISNIPNASYNQKQLLLNKVKTELGFTTNRSNRLAYQDNLYTDTTTGQTKVDFAGVTNALANSGLDPTERQQYINALKQESGQATIESDARAAAVEQTKYDLDSRRSEFGIQNTHKRIDTMEDFDERSRAYIAVERLRARNISEELINRALRVSIEEEIFGSNQTLINSRLEDVIKLMQKGDTPKPPPKKEQKKNKDDASKFSDILNKFNPF